MGCRASPQPATTHGWLQFTNDLFLQHNFVIRQVEAQKLGGHDEKTRVRRDATGLRLSFGPRSKRPCTAKNCGKENHPCDSEWLHLPFFPQSFFPQSYFPQSYPLVRAIRQHADRREPVSYSRAERVSEERTICPLAHCSLLKGSVESHLVVITLRWRTSSVICRKASLAVPLDHLRKGRNHDRDLDRRTGLRRRRQARLGLLSPVEFRAVTSTPTTLLPRLGTVS